VATSFVAAAAVVSGQVALVGDLPLVVGFD
jgi:hypothetical protein